jgi:pyridoxal phosphate enzyme (YggS family)
LSGGPDDDPDSMGDSIADIPERLTRVRRRIDEATRASGRSPGAVTLLAVSKTQPPKAIAAAWQAGQRRFGENYLQEALPKIDALGALDIEWHFIGRLQGNKTAQVATRFDWVHTVADLRHARRLSAQRPPDRPPLQICIQVNIGGERTKGGLAPSELAGLAHATAELPSLALRGLMTLPPPSVDVDAQRRAFRELRGLQEALVADGLPLDTLSMGMSGDMEAAIAEGATIVRIGTDVFGPRT